MERPEPAEHGLRMRLFLAVGAVLIACMVWLAIAFYNAQISLRAHLVKDFRHEMEMQAGSMESFFQDRLNDLQALAESRSISGYFADKALGVTLEYGLKADLVQVEHELKKTIEEKEAARGPAYKNLSLFDPSGRLLIETGRGGFGIPADLPDLLDWEATLIAPEILVAEREGARNVLGLAPIVLNGKPVGTILAEIDACPVFKKGAGHIKTDLGGAIQLAGKRRGQLLNLCGGDPAEAGSRMIGSFALSEQVTPQPIEEQDLERLRLVLPLKGTPLALLVEVPLSQLYGALSTKWLLFFLGGFVFVLLTVLGFLLRAEFRGSVLKRKLAEEEKAKRIQLEEMAERLDHEIRERAQAQISSARKNELLEGVREVLTDTLTSSSTDHVARSSLMVAEKLTLHSPFGFIGAVNPEGLFKVLSMSHTGWSNCGIDGALALELFFRRGLERHYGRSL